MTTKTDILSAQVMVACPKEGSAYNSTSVKGSCKGCAYCAGIVKDPISDEITGVLCDFNRQKS